MPPIVAQTILIIVAAYAVVGILFAVPFVAFGAGRIDPAARSTPLGFRLLILPGAAALWPLMLRRWIGAPPNDETAHP